jgi:predicted chitinase
MTFATFRAAAEHIARTGTITPHQLAAWEAAWKHLTDEQRQAFTDDWRAAGSPAAPPPAPALVTMAQATAVFTRAPISAQLADLNYCLRRFNINTPTRIRHFLAQVGHESGGLRWLMELASGDAYEGRADLGNTQPGDGRRFKGAGAIQLTGRANYQRFANFISDPRVMQGAAVVAELYAFTSAGFWWADNRINDLIDAGATCRQISARVNGRDPANGLADREAYFARAVVAIAGPPAPAVPAQVLISRAPYFFQRDSATNQGDRMCFSSTCAMAIETMKPGTLAGPDQEDDRYLRLLQGDTTDVAAHVRAMKSLGIDATFRQNLGIAAVEDELRAGRPVPVGWLHQGPLDRPRGGGHWSLIVGATDTHWIIHDPFGEANMVAGGYVSTTATAGRFVRYTKANFNRRWMVEPYQGAYRFAPGKGWGLLLRLT